MSPPESEVEFSGRARGGPSNLEIGKQIGVIAGRLEEMNNRMSGIEASLADLRRFAHLADTVAMQANDNARRLTNVEETMERWVRVVADMRKLQDAARVGEMAPRELAVLPEMCRDFIDRQEAEQSFEERIEHRLARLTAYSALGQTFLAGITLVLAYLVSHH